MYFWTKLALDSASGAGSSAGTAVDAGISIDYILAVSLRNSANGTFGSAASAAYTSVTNNVCHNKLPPLKLYPYITLILYHTFQLFKRKISPEEGILV